MPRRRVQVFSARDWTGGLNYRDDSFGMPTNQLSDMLNMRILPTGGLKRRATCKALNASDLSSARNIFQFLGNSVQQIIVQIGNTITVGTGSSTFTSAGTAAPWNVTTSGIMRAATFARVGTATSERLYVQRNMEQVAFKWDGTVGTAMADSHGAYNDNVLAPAGGKMPKAKYICAHAGFLFHAYITDALLHTSRIRWSHPQEPEDYRTNDFEDLGENDGDVITGMVSSGHTLYVFKARSIWAVNGTDPTNFSFTKVFEGIGAVSQEAITLADDGSVFFYNEDRGVYAIDHQGHLQWLWEQIAPKIVDNTIPAQTVPPIVLGWMDHRLWVSVPWLTSSTNNRVFVFDPRCGKSGAWYVYRYCDGGLVATNVGLGPMIEWNAVGARPMFLAVDAGGTQVLQIDYDEGTVDTFKNTGPSTSTYTSFFTTAWFTAGQPGIKKRWRGPSMIFNADHDAVVGMAIYADYTSLDPMMVMQHQITAQHDGGKLWGSNLWGSVAQGGSGDNWGKAPDGEQLIMRHNPIGNAYAIQIRLDGPTAQQWGFSSFEFRYILKAVR